MPPNHQKSNPGSVVLAETDGRRAVAVGAPVTSCGWLAASDLLSMGWDEATIANLPVTYYGTAGVPCGHVDDLRDLVMQEVTQ